ncbi:hypothetical protein ABZ746_15635 [Streptomyces sp. NPDC020096]
MVSRHPGELAYVLGPDLVAEVAEDGRGRRFRPEELPSGLTHEPTRRLLTEIGLPFDADIFTLDDGPLRTMAEVHPDVYDVPADEKGKNPYTDREYQRNFIALGWWPHDLNMGPGRCHRPRRAARLVRSRVCRRMVTPCASVAYQAVGLDHTEPGIDRFTAMPKPFQAPENEVLW